MTFAESIGAGLIWYLAITGVGLATFPFLYLVCTNLSDRGISLYRPVGLAMVPLPLWMIGNLWGVPLTPLTVVISALFIAIPGWVIAYQRTDMIGFVRKSWRRILTFECITFGLFFLYLIFRGFNPDISGTEKPMELAFLSASMYSGEIPVEDPWFAGEPINYYYFGYVALGSIGLVIGLPSGVVFNLGLATTFACLVAAGAGLAANLSDAASSPSATRAAVAGALGGYLIALAGNLNAAIEFVRNPSSLIDTGWWDGIGWRSSRVIEDGGFESGAVRTVITEFPAFSWVLGDLHPHVIAFPWLVVTFALGINAAFSSARNSGLMPTLLTSVPVGIALAVLFSANSWDVPFAALVFIVAVFSVSPSPVSRGTLLSLMSAAITALIVAGPFLLRYASPTGITGAEYERFAHQIPGVRTVVSSLGYVSWNRSSLSELLTVHGALVALIVVAIVAFSILETGVLAGPRRSMVAAGAGAVLLGILFGSWAIPLFGIPLIAVIVLLRTTRSGDGAVAGLVLANVALIVIIGVEFFYVRDPFGDRMNTVFKLAFQAWAALAIAAAVLIPVSIQKLREVGGSPRLLALLLGVVCIGLSATALYTPVSAYKWSNGFANWYGIDGLAYLERAQPGDAAAIEWLIENAAPGDRVLEAPGCAYGSDNFIPHNRVSMATGMPTLIGWDGHQHQWRRGQPALLAEVSRRIDFAGQLYQEPRRSTGLLDEFAVRYVFVGSHEVSGYARCEHGPPYAIPDDQVLEEGGWNLAFRESGTSIYRVD